MPLIDHYDVVWHKRYYVLGLFVVLVGRQVIPWSKVMLLLLGSLGTLYAIGNVVINSKVVPRAPSSRIKKFEFMKRWYQELNDMNSYQQELEHPIFEQSFLCSETIDEFIELILNEFVDSWFTKVSPDVKFRSIIKIELNNIVGNLKNRLQPINYSKLLVSKILPIFNNHFYQFLQVINKLDESDPLVIARLFPLHHGVTINLIEKDNYREKIYLRQKIRSILPFLLSSKENNSDLILVFVTELLACSILTNVFDMISEADFYNVLITKLIGDNLKHRDQVKQLRAALEQHTSQLSSKTSVRSLRNEPTHNNSIYILSENLDNVAFKAICNTVSDVTAYEELKTIQKSISVQLEQSSNSFKLNNRLQILNKIVYKKLHQIDQLEDYTLMDILTNHYQIFAEFMNYRKRLTTLQFWKDVELIKAPLEADDLSLSVEFSTIQDVNNIYLKYFKNDLISISNESQNDFINLKKNPNVFIYRQCRLVLFDLQNDLYQEMDELDLPLFKKSSLFTKISSSFPKRKTSIVLINQHNIENSDTGLKGNGEDEVSPEVIQAVEDAFTAIMKNPTVEHSNVHDIEFSSQNAKLKKGLFQTSEVDSRENLFDDELKLEEKMFDSSSNTESTFNELSSKYSHLVNESNEKLQPKSYDSRLLKLFDEPTSDSDSIKSDSPMMNSMDLEEKFDGSQVYLASPGNLSLAEEISKLSEEIERLNEQLIILEPLLKKASITNNVAELKILNKSQVSLEKEIKYKELQLQQYIVQENDNSLYGKSRVTIQSYVVGNDEKQNGKEFILYIMEVQKFGEDPQQITAGWIVARRFSQFFKLNEYLCARYKQVNQIKFPKRTVLKPHKQLIESRKSQLEEYLRQLIEIPQVCSDKIFRSFLSSENFNLTNNFEKVDLKSTRNNNADIVMNKLYNISGKFSSKPNQRDVMENLRDMQKELQKFDDVTNQIFVKPICNLLILIFKLNHSQSWLRGRALVVILQQIFGTTIENMVNQQVDKKLRNETTILDLLNGLKNIVFPNGKFKDPPVPRTIYEKSTSKKEARVLLTIFIHETCSKIFGASNSNYASSKIFLLLQNDYLNKSVLFSIFDKIIEELFPELNSN